jgi:hypothetical protein
MPKIAHPFGGFKALGASTAFAVTGAGPPPTRIRPMARARSDIANMAVRIFLQEIGADYDRQRDLPPFQDKDFKTVKEFFGNRCCYCDADFDVAQDAVQDHLEPVNRTDLGLHAWGNVVPACRDCNAKKHGGNWKDFIIHRAGDHAAERHKRVLDFLKKYHYKPTREIRGVAEELYDEVGGVAMTLIQAKVKRLREASL